MDQDYEFICRHRTVGHITAVNNDGFLPDYHPIPGQPVALCPINGDTGPYAKLLLGPEWGAGDILEEAKFERVCDELVATKLDTVENNWEIARLAISMKKGEPGVLKGVLSWEHPTENSRTTGWEWRDIS